MNKNAKITLVLSCAAFGASVYSLAAAAAYQPYGTVPTPPPAVTVSATDATNPTSLPTTAPSPYRTRIIRLYRGKAAVFEEGSDVPVSFLPTDISQLPDDAVERLRAGVYAYTAEQYRNYVEDFS